MYWVHIRQIYLYRSGIPGLTVAGETRLPTQQEKFTITRLFENILEGGEERARFVCWGTFSFKPAYLDNLTK